MTILSSNKIFPLNINSFVSLMSLLHLDMLLFVYFKCIISDALFVTFTFITLIYSYFFASWQFLLISHVPPHLSHIKWGYFSPSVFSVLLQCSNFYQLSFYTVMVNIDIQCYNVYWALWINSKYITITMHIALTEELRSIPWKYLNIFFCCLLFSWSSCLSCPYFF